MRFIIFLSVAIVLGCTPNMNVADQRDLVDQRDFLITNQKSTIDRLQSEKFSNARFYSDLLKTCRDDNVSLENDITSLKEHIAEVLADNERLKGEDTSAPHIESHTWILQAIFEMNSIFEAEIQSISYDAGQDVSWNLKERNIKAYNAYVHYINGMMNLSKIIRRDLKSIDKKAWEDDGFVALLMSHNDRFLNGLSYASQNQIRSNGSFRDFTKEKSSSSYYMCRDGSVSPSCVCGQSRRGCCSHHGGVAGCQ